MINMQLAQERNLSDEAVQALNTLHAMMNHTLTNPHFYDDPVNVIKSLEYAMQSLWGFDLDEDYHIHWIRINGCTCPKMDNHDFNGMYNIYMADCPWHGWENPETGDNYGNR